MESETTPGLWIFTRTLMADRPLLVTLVELETDSTVPLTGASKLPAYTVAGWPT